MMKRTLLTTFFLCVLLFHANASENYEWQRSEWISKSYDCKSQTHCWLGFRKHVEISEVPSELVARIAADTKYWMWINGELVIYEGGLKRGPAPGDSYYDRFDIAPYLRQGDNLISILLWHFGQNGFSHLNSGLAAIRMEAFAQGVEIKTDASWEAAVIPAYKIAPGPATNFRLPEESIQYDARLYKSEWMKGGAPKRLGGAIVVSSAVADRLMGRLVERPIPMFKISDLREYESIERKGSAIRCRLPYNCHFHPYLKIRAASGKRIIIKSDHDIVTNAKCVHAEYVSRNGEQSYESLPWLNGEMVEYQIPEGVEVLELKYRESSYDCSVSGHFNCDDELLNSYWKKAARTLLVCMRDTWYDCPDRERAQWWGDEVNELNAAFYALSPSSSKLALKGIRELCAWQRNDASLHAPIPSGNYFSELPMQILNSVGWYGFRNYYWYSADSSFVADIYPAVHRYLHETWKLDENGLPIYRTGEWDWPDAGHHQDGKAQLAPWYLLALKAECEWARMLGIDEDLAENERIIARIKDSYNRIFWNGNSYLSPGHNDVPDDRVQALAVLSGIADADKYEKLCAVLAEQAHATTYMFCYVLEALVKMGKPEMALERMRRFYPTVMKDDCSTLYEHWNFDGSSNHAWTSSGITILGRFIAGIDALEPGFKKFSVRPQMGDLKRIDCSLETIYGKIAVKLERKRGWIEAIIEVPESCTALCTDRKGKELVLASGIHKVRL